MKTRDEMIAHIADAWVDGIDIKGYFRQMFFDYTEELEAWTDEDILAEYNELTEE